MRIKLFGLAVEIHFTRQTSYDNTVWHLPPGLPRRLGDMSPTELRRDLATLRHHLKRPGASVGTDSQDPFGRVYLRQQHLKSDNVPSSRDREDFRSKKAGGSL